MIRTLMYTGPSLDVLHEEYVKQGRIDDTAPIRGRREIVVNAPVHQVWQSLIDVPSWDINLEPGVRNIQLDHGVAVDARFTRSNKGVRMKARFGAVQENRELAWTGSALGAKVVHRFALQPRGADSTHVVVEESMAGPLLAFLFSERKLLSVLDDSLAALKVAAEAAPSRRSPPG